jgi:uncharacterized SAM-binding protein YcdF (DUF218 family)
MSRHPLLRRVALVCLAASLIGAVCLLRLPLLARVGTWLDVGVVPTGYDYVLVLNGEENTRPFAAVALVKAGLAQRVILTTCASAPEQEDGLALPVHEVSRQVLLRRGVPAERIIVLERAVDSTFDEARALADFLQREPDARVAIVTNPFHTRRARWILARELGPRADQISMISAPQEDLALDRWWTTWVGRETVPAEYLRLFYYWFRYGWTPWLLILLVVVLAVLVRCRRSRNLGDCHASTR